MNDVRTALFDSGLPRMFWEDALQYAVYTRNRLPNKSGTVPVELFKRDDEHHSVDYSHLRAFGSPCVCRVAKQESKLNRRGREGLMIGYGTGTTSYSLLTEDKRVVISRDVAFIPDQVRLLPLIREDFTEETGPIKDIEKPDSSDEPLGEEELEEGVANEEEEQQVPRRPAPRRARGWHIEVFDREAAPSPETDPETIHHEDNENPAVEGFRRSNRLAGVFPEYDVPLDGAPQAGLMTGGLEHALSAQAIFNPQTYQEARNSGEWENWKEAMDEELGKMQKYDVWDVVPRSNQRTLTGKWVYTRKIDGDTGKPAAYKARFVVRGFQQVAGRDFDELFASVAHKPSLRVFLSIVNYIGWECDQMDVIGAFLKGDIDKD